MNSWSRILAVLVLAAPSTAQLLGPTPYVHPFDSPFSPATFAGYFHREDLENNHLDTPGLHAQSTMASSVAPPGPFTDSVDSDDGAVDGSGLGGHSFVIGSDGNPIGQFLFEGTELGRLPSHAGLVVTDAYDPVVVEFFAWNNVSLGSVTITGFGPFPDTQGQTAEDRFVGCIHPAGIRRMVVSTQGSGGIEVDHIQYGSLERPFTPYCSGDGSATACPCGNVGQPDRGCPNSLYAGGGRLTAFGHASLSEDTVVLAAFDMPDSTALWFAGSAQFANGNGAQFGDGLRCVGGTIVRLAARPIMMATSFYPTAADPPLSTGMSVGQRRYFQVRYRNAAAFCTLDTFNLTNGMTVLWNH